MENLFHILAPTRLPLTARYGITAIIVGVFFLIRLGMAEKAGLYGFFVFIPSVFIASIVFDRGSGFLATALSVVGVLYVIEPFGSFEVRREHIIPLTFFTLECLAIATLCEALRRALQRTAAAEREKDLLFRELAHRSKNNLQMIVSLLRLQSRGQQDPAARQALEQVMTRVRVIANAQNRLQPDGHEGALDLRDYLEDLCRDLGDSLRDLRPVAVRVTADPITVGPDKATSIGLIVNELVTNAFKYAFPDGNEGAVDVILRRLEEGEVELAVRDNGVGCTSVHEGLGSRLVRLLVQQLGGSFAREPVKSGCLVTVRFSL